MITPAELRRLANRHHASDVQSALHEAANRIEQQGKGTDALLIVARERIEQLVAAIASIAEHVIPGTTDSVDVILGWRRALEWYATESHYSVWMPDGRFGPSTWPSNEDRGERARRALAGEGET